MLDSTVFVVGAGASREVGLPVASGLISWISRKLSFEVRRGHLLNNTGDAEVLEALNLVRQGGRDLNLLLRASWRVRDGARYANSIDTFMDNHVEDNELQVCAKLAIAKSIVEAENASTLYTERGSPRFRDEDKVLSAWYGPLFRHLSDGVRRSELERIFKKVRFIVFNYDRCLEHFLFNALQTHYGVERKIAAEVMGTLYVAHPYGAIAPLPWQDEREGVDFGRPVSGFDLQRMAGRIKTFTERVDTGQELEEIRSVLANAKSVVFLGFSYHRMNMELLKPQEPCAATRVFGTTHGLSEDDIQKVREALAILIGRGRLVTKPTSSGSQRFEAVNLPSVECSQLLNQYSRGLFIAGH